MPFKTSSTLSIQAIMFSRRETCLIFLTSTECVSFLTNLYYEPSRTCLLAVMRSLDQ